jgi:phosphatidylinositol glycan class O
MITGIVIMALGVVTLVVYASRDDEEDFAILENVELDMAEKAFEVNGIAGDSGPSYQTTHRSLVLSAIVGAATGAIGGGLCILALPQKDWIYVGAAAMLGCNIGILSSLTRIGKPVSNILPGSLWGWMAATFTVSQSIGFASNSYTIWEDSITLFFLGTFGLVTAMASLGLQSRNDRTLGVYHSIMFVVLGRLASFSKLCREEQMPYCTSTYYASSTSSTSAPWQLIIPFATALILPSIIRSFLMASRSYEGMAPTWIGTAYRCGLLMAATYWLLDAASVGNWIPSIRETILKSISVYWAQLVLGISLVAGSTAFIWTLPCVSVFSSTSRDGTAQVTILGYGNAHGARYLLLPLNLLAACILLSKPMGGGALGLMLWQVLSLVEILELNSLTSEAIGPVMLALLGNFHFFKTGHQAILSSIQWDSAFIALSTIRYPWSPLAIMFNTFAGQIMAISLVPLIVLWKVGPKRKGVLESVSRALGGFVAFFATETLATMMWSGYLRRHLMLYRVFSPRFMTGVVILLVVDVMGILISLVGTRTNTFSISEVFGWAD